MPGPAATCGGVACTWKPSGVGGLTGDTALECLDPAVHRALEHGVPVSVGGVDVAGPDERIRRRPRRYRISHQSLSRARARLCVAGRRDRTPFRRQAGCSVRSRPDDRRRPRDGVRAGLGMADRGAHRCRHRRRAAQRADVENGNGLVRRQGNRHRDGDLRQFLAGGDRIVSVCVAGACCRTGHHQRLAADDGILWAGICAAGGVVSVACSDRPRSRRRFCYSGCFGCFGFLAASARDPGGGRRGIHLGSVQCRGRHGLWFRNHHAGRARLESRRGRLGDEPGVVAGQRIGSDWQLFSNEPASRS